MEENNIKQNNKKSIKIGEFLLCILLTVLITATCMVLLYTYLLKDNSQQISTATQQNGVQQENLKGGQTVYNEENNVDTNQEVNSNVQDEKQYTDAISQTITLNGTQHNISIDFYYGEQSSQDLTDITMRLAFDSQYIKYVDTYKFEGEVLGEENVKFHIVEGYDKKEYLVLETNFAATPTWYDTTLYIIDERGNTTSTLLFTGGMGMSINGEPLAYEVGDEYKSYRIEKDYIEWYQYNGESTKTQDITAVKYKAGITTNGLLDINVEEVYSSEEVELSGKV